MNTNEVVLKSGTRCTFNADNCIDVEAGNVFWDLLPTTSCEQNKYAELYAGFVNKIIEENHEQNPVFITEWNEITFTFGAIGTIPICSFDLMRTEHPKLFFLEGLAMENFVIFKTPTIHNLHIFAYVNSKFVYVEKHIKGQLTRLYHDFIIQKCELEKSVIMNLSSAVSASNLFAF